MKAMILAAGRGERMRPLTDHTPKSLLLAARKPLIVWHMEALARAGIRDVVINHAYLGYMIEAALGDGGQFGVRIRYSPEREALETAGGIAHALPLLGIEPFAVINADVYTDFDLSQLVAIASQIQVTGPKAALVLVPNPQHHPAGDFSLHNGFVSNDDIERLTFSGIGVYHPSLFADIGAGQRAPLGPMLKRLAEAGQVRGVVHRGLWMDIGTPERLDSLNRLLSARIAT